MTQAHESIGGPVPLEESHDLAAFDSGEPALDTWLRERALHNEQRGGSRTYVVCAEARVVGFFSLATGSVEQAKAPGRIKRNMPEPIPVMILGRLAVDNKFKGRGIGRGLLREAILKILLAAEIVGARAILVDAISEDAKHLYLRHGFRESPVDSMMLMITLADAQAAISR